MYRSRSYRYSSSLLRISRSEEFAVLQTYFGYLLTCAVARGMTKQGLRNGIESRGLLPLW